MNDSQCCVSPNTWLIWNLGRFISTRVSIQVTKYHHQDIVWLILTFGESKLFQIHFRWMFSIKKSSFYNRFVFSLSNVISLPFWFSAISIWYKRLLFSKHVSILQFNHFLNSSTKSLWNFSFKALFENVVF